MELHGVTGFAKFRYFSFVFAVFFAGPLYITPSFLRRFTRGTCLISSAHFCNIFIFFYFFTFLIFRASIRPLTYNYSITMIECVTLAKSAFLRKYRASHTPGFLGYSAKNAIH